MLENAATRYCKPEIIFNSKEWVIEGKKVLEVNIPRSKMQPHRAPDHNNNYRAFIRVQDQNIMANGIQMKIWQKSNTNKDINFVYSNDIKLLLSLIEDQGTSTLKQIQTNINLSRYKIENMLAELIVLKVITMQIEEDSITFSLNDIVNNDF